MRLSINKSHGSSINLVNLTSNEAREKIENSLITVKSLAINEVCFD
jgi:hypothetical protein